MIIAISIRLCKNCDNGNASVLLFSYPNLKSGTKEKRNYFPDSLISVQ